MDLNKDGRIGRSNMSYKILTWNINQATDRYGKNVIPALVGKEIELREADLVVLTEFCYCQNASEFLEKTFVENGYAYFPQDFKNKQNKAALTNMIFFMIFYFQQKAPGIIPT